MGRNSVSPCTIPRMIACRTVMTLLEDGVAGARAEEGERV
jgi:hypothetical protein